MSHFFDHKPLLGGKKCRICSCSSLSQIQSFMFIYMIRAKWLKLSYWQNVKYFLADDVLHPVWEITSCAFSGAPSREREGHWCLTVPVTGTYLKMEFNLILKNAAERSRCYRNTISSTLTILPSTLLLLGNGFAAFPCFLLVLFD